LLALQAARELVAKHHKGEAKALVGFVTNYRSFVETYMPDATEQYCVIVDLLEMALEASTNLKVAYPRSAGFNDVEIHMIKNVRMLFLEKSGRHQQYLEARKEWTKDQLKYFQDFDPV
jgi:hypothetical protein